MPPTMIPRMVVSSAVPMCKTCCWLAGWLAGWQIQIGENGDAWFDRSCCRCSETAWLAAQLGSRAGKRTCRASKL
jgi:hypothetical protein